MYVDSKLSVIRRRAVGNGFREELTILNHEDKPVDLTIRIEAGCDFADLFEVKDALEKKGRATSRGSRTDTCDWATSVTPSSARPSSPPSAPARLDKRGLTFPPGSPRTSMGDRPRRGHRDRGLRRGAQAAQVRTAGRATRAARPTSEAGWTRHRPSSANGTPCGATYRRSLVDLARCASRRRGRGRACRRRGALVHDDVWPRQHLHEPPGTPIHAGVAATTLRALGEWQGTRIDDFRDEDRAGSCTRCATER